MKLAIYQPRVSYYIGGGEIVPLMHAKYLSELGHAVTIVTTAQTKPSDIYAEWKKTTQVDFVELKIPSKHEGVYEEPAGTNRDRWDYESLAIAQLALQFFEANAFDLAASHYLLDVLGIPPNQKSVLHLHGFPATNNPLNSVFMRFPDAVVGVSRFVLRKWAELTVLPIAQHVCYNGVEDLRKVSTIDVGDVDLLFVGRLIPRKGAQYAIEATKILRERGVPAHLTIVGTGPFERQLIEMANRGGLSKFVAFKGLRPHNEVMSFFNSSNICLFPSFGREGMPTTILEAMSFGKLVIATNNFGIEELITSGKDGILIPEKDSLALAEAILSLKSNGKRASTIGKNAGKKVLRDWLWPTQVKKLEKVYQSVLA